MSIPPLRLPFASEAAALDISERLSEPAWLRDERRDAAALVASLPAESNLLFTPYLDLRAVRFDEMEPYATVVVAPEAEQATLPDGTGAFIHVREDALVARSLGQEASAAGIRVLTFEEALDEDPAVVIR